MPSAPLAIAPTAHRDDNARYFARDFARKFSSDFARDFARYSAHGFARYFARDFARNFSSDFASDFARYFTRDFARNFSSDFARVFVRYFGRDFARGFGGDFGRDFASDFTMRYINNETPEVTRYFSAPRGLKRPMPNTEEAGGENELRSAATAEGGGEDAIRWISTCLARLIVEAWIAALTGFERSKAERAAYIHRRVENAWLYQIWPAVDHRLAAEPSDDALALYLTLGWAQATTTWQWPATDRWRELAGGDPPANWLPRSQWLLCWLLHDPDDQGHRQSLRQALEEGLADEDRPGVAAVLRTLFFEDAGAAP